MDSIRPKKSVQVRCSKCRWEFWVDALHPGLATGVLDCGADHVSQEIVDRVFDQLEALGLHWSQRSGDTASGWARLRFGKEGAYDEGQFTVLAWTSPEELAALPHLVEVAPKMSYDVAKAVAEQRRLDREQSMPASDTALNLKRDQS